MKKILLFVSFVILGTGISAKTQPNILWLLTDDQRYDSIQVFNKILTGEEMSPLGYVESPQVDRLASMGTTFINTYCQAQGCAPSRASMHYGRYPFRTGIYEFEWHNNNAEHTKPTLPEQMAELGYQTLHVGKLGVRVRRIDEDGSVKGHPIYQTDIDFKTLGKEGLSDYYYGPIDELDGKKLPGIVKRAEFFPKPDGTVDTTGPELNQMPGYENHNEQIDQKYEFFRHYNEKKKRAPGHNMIIAGVSPQPAGKTRDGYYSSVMADFLAAENEEFDVGSLKYQGVDTQKPLFVHIGYDFPHTPVIPPESYRERFAQYEYDVPELTDEEWRSMPKQLQRQAKAGFSDGFTDHEKQLMIRDYYAFCAYGDEVIGNAVDAFIQYSEKQGQPWMIVYVCGDHGWKLNEHGSISKFTPWDVDSHNPIIVVSSDKEAFPAGKVVRDFTEFVDIAPTCLAAAGADLETSEFDYLDGFDLAKVGAEEVARRDYVIGESHAVTGPRAFIRTDEYVFSMQTRPNKNRGENMHWALSAEWEELDPALYHMTSDPNEVRNLAFDPKYRSVAGKMKDKLARIVLGDNRVEINWGRSGGGTELHRSNFAPGAHDGKLLLD